MKGLVEQNLLFATVDQYCRERGMQIGTVFHAHAVHRAQGVDDPAGADRQPGGAQQPAEVKDVLR